MGNKIDIQTHLEHTILMYEKMEIEYGLLVDVICKLIEPRFNARDDDALPEWIIDYVEKEATKAKPHFRNILKKLSRKEWK